MKTFLGFMTGLLGGAILGVIVSSAVLLEDNGAREYLNKTAEKLNNY